MIHIELNQLSLLFPAFSCYCSVTIMLRKVELKAILVQNDGALVVDEIDVPDIGKDEILVRVEACGVNRADLMQKKGLYPAPQGTRNDILGLEFAGRIAACGSAVGSRWSIGDAVMGILPGCAYAQFVVIHHRLLLPVPKQMSMEEAACIPEVFLTAYDAMIKQLQLSRGDRLLVHAIGSGVGDAIYQLATTWGVSIWGTTRTFWKLEPYMKLEQGICVSDGDFASKMSGKVDAIVDFVGGSYLQQNIRVLRTGGQLLILGLLGGAQAQIPLGQILVKRLKVFGSTLRARSLEDKIALMESFSKRVLPDFERGLLHPTLDRMFSWEDVDEAHRYMEENVNRGKVVLRVVHEK